MAIFLPSLLAIGVWLWAWALGHAVGTPSAAFNALNRSNTLWVVGLILLTPTGIVMFLALYYLTKVRPDLNQIQRQGAHAR